MATSPFATPQIDFQRLANLPQLYEQGQKNARARQLRNAFAGGIPKGPNKEIDYGAMSQMFAEAGDPASALKAAEAGRKDRMTPYQAESLAIKREELARGPQMTPYQEHRVAADEEQRAEKDQATQGRKDTLAAELGRLKNTATDLKAHPGLPSATGEYSVMGVPTGMAATDVYTRPGSDAANFEAQFENLKSQVGFNVLQAMHQASQTGGALGQVAVQELTMLQNNLGALDPRQSPEAFAEQLQKIADYTDQVVQRLGTVGSETGGQGVPSGPPQPGQTVNGYRYKGGNPNDQNSWEPAQ